MLPEEHTHTEPVRVVVVTEFVPARDVPARDAPARDVTYESESADAASGDTALVPAPAASAPAAPAAASPELQPAVALLTLRALRGETCIVDVGFTTEGLRVYAVPEYQALARTVAGELLMYTAHETRWEMIVRWMLGKVAVVEEVVKRGE